MSTYIATGSFQVRWNHEEELSLFRIMLGSYWLWLYHSMALTLFLKSYEILNNYY
jgi:hypothetical protein